MKFSLIKEKWKLYIKYNILSHPDIGAGGVAHICKLSELQTCKQLYFNVQYTFSLLLTHC